MKKLGKPLREITVEPLEMPKPLRRDAPAYEPQKIEQPSEPVPVRQG